MTSLERMFAPKRLAKKELEPNFKITFATGLSSTTRKALDSLRAHNMCAPLPLNSDLTACARATPIKWLPQLPDSMTQSAPSNIALATSELSARVGRGLWTILSNICGNKDLLEARLISQHQCFARLVSVGGHFRNIQKRRTSSIFVFCPFSRETNWHKLRKVY